MVNLAQSLKEILKPVNSNPQKKKKNRKSRNKIKDTGEDNFYSKLFLFFT